MVDGVARLLCLRTKLTEGEMPPVTKNWNACIRKYPDRDLKFAKVRLLDNGVDSRMAHLKDSPEAGLGENGIDAGIDKNYSTRTSILHEVRSIRELLEKNEERKLKQEERERYNREWKVIACVTDRLFFIIYVLINIGGVVMTFKGAL